MGRDVGRRVLAPGSTHPKTQARGNPRTSPFRPRQRETRSGPTTNDVHEAQTRRAHVRAGAPAASGQPAQRAAAPPPAPRGGA